MRKNVKEERIFLKPSFIPLYLQMASNKDPMYWPESCHYHGGLALHGVLSLA